jgi:site-specific DNA recombinase
MASPIRKDKPIRAAIYARVSTAEQIDNTSLDEQRRKCRNAAEARGWVVSAEFVDEGVSGSKADRPEWRAMLRAAANNEIDAVIVAKIDRFSRNAGHAITEMDNLTGLGVMFVAVDNEIDLSTMQGRMMRTVMMGFAEMEREMIADRSVSGQRAKARNGQWPGGQPPYGWRLEGRQRDARPVPDEQERRVIWQAYTWFVKHGYSAMQVAEALNSARLAPRRGGNWSHQSVRRLFRNPTLWSGKTAWAKPDGDDDRPKHRAHRTKMGRDGQPAYGETIELSLPEPPLTKREFATLQKALPRKWSHGTVRLHPLSGRLIAQCGNYYVGVSITNGQSERVVAYRCNGRRRQPDGNTCTCSQLPGLPLEARVWAEVVALLGDPEALTAMASSWLRLNVEDCEKDDGELIERVESRVQRLETALKKATREMLMADDDEALREAKADLERELRSARDSLNGLRVIQADAADRASRLSSLADLARNASERLNEMNPEQQREVLGLLGVQVTVTDASDRQNPSIVIEGTVDARLFESSSPGDAVGGPRPLLGSD